jgi:hypothetical protein
MQPMVKEGGVLFFYSLDLNIEISILKDLLNIT